MDPRPSGDPTIVVSTTDPELLDHALSVVAAAGLEAEVTSDPGFLRARWGGASMVLVGVDQAPGVAELRLPRRADVYLLTETGTAPEAYQWSVPLGAAVVVVPGNAQWLSGAIADLSRGPSGSGQMICVTGGSGGVGNRPWRRGSRSWPPGLADPPRWSTWTPVGAGSICWSAPSGWAGGAGRGWLRPEAIWVTSETGCPAWTGSRCCRWAGVSRRSRPAPEAVRAVLGSLTVSHDLTVVDVPRHLENDQLESLSTAGAWLLVVRDDLRGATAGRECFRTLEAVGVRPGLVVRVGRSRLLDPQSVAEGVGADLHAVLGDEPGLLQAAERGDPPGRSGRSPLGQVARRLLDEIGRSLDAVRAEVPADPAGAPSDASAKSLTVWRRPGTHLAAFSSVALRLGSPPSSALRCTHLNAANRQGTWPTRHWTSNHSGTGWPAWAGRPRRPTWRRPCGRRAGSSATPP